MKQRSVLTIGMALLGLVALPSWAAAAPLAGTISLTNNVVGGVGGVNVTLHTLAWLPPVGATGGQFLVGTPTTGSFAFLAGDTGTAQNLNDTAQPAGAPFPLIAPNTTLPGEGTVLANFMTFDTGAPYGAAAGNVHFDLNFVDLGAFTAFAPACYTSAPAAGDVCSIPGSPFTLTDTTATTSTVAFAVSGYVRDNAGELSTFTGVYTTQFGSAYQPLLATILSGGTVTNTYSGTFTASIVPVVPEPMTLLTLGTGIMGLGRRLRRSKKA
jgi:hypothetical protein